MIFDEDFKNKMKELAALLGYKVDFDTNNNYTFHFYKIGGYRINCYCEKGKFSVYSVLPSSSYPRIDVYKTGGFDLRNVNNARLSKSILNRILSGYDDALTEARKYLTDQIAKKSNAKQQHDSVVNCCSKFFNIKDDEYRKIFYINEKSPNFSSFTVDYTRGYDLKIREVPADLMIKIVALIKEHQITI